jgi:crotonobetainyl-CoA:carnitine CoA-transferase CaiB-like acyl-CoA transferase
MSQELPPTSPPAPTPPLDGLRVLELASILAGPMTGQFLAELGADVIKIENPATGGDPTRHWHLASERADAEPCAYFSCANWGKRSLALNVATDGGRRAVHDLARQSDVVIASYKPGDAGRLGVDAATLLGLNPKLIVAEISAYGGDDPRPGFDAIIQAEAGFTHLNGEPDGAPLKMPVALMDLLAAHQLKEAILVALLQRCVSGSGRHVQVSLLEAGISSLANQATNYLVAGVVPQRMGSEHPNIVPYGSVYALGDGRQLVLAVGTERQWRRLAEAVARVDLAEHAEYADNRARVRNRTGLHAELAAAFAGLDSASASRRLREAGVPFGFVNDMAAVFRQPQADRVLLRDGELHGVRSFVASGVGTVPALRAPPRYDADGEAILRERLGYDDERLEALLREGAWRS